jgi:bacterioferritin-associated ferredoxin
MVFTILFFAMYVCVCFAVTDREIEAAVDAGAETCEAVTKACEAGGDCGSCHEMIEQIIDAKRLTRERAA